MTNNYIKVIVEAPSTSVTAISGGKNKDSQLSTYITRSIKYKLKRKCLRDVILALHRNMVLKKLNQGQKIAVTLVFHNVLAIMMVMKHRKLSFSESSSMFYFLSRRRQQVHNLKRWELNFYDSKM